MDEDLVDLLRALVASDILTALTGLTCEAFIKNRRATGRAKDLGDIEGME